MMVQNSLLRRAVPALAGCALLALSGCGSDLSRSFGLVRDSPDEFTVTTRAPLSMPPDFSLRAPDPGAPRPQERTASNAAEAALVPQSAMTPAAGLSPGQQALVQEAGPPAPDSIRARVDRDASLAGSDRSFADRLMFWRSPPPPGVVVDPAREKQRLKENAALGQSVEQGDTPIIQRKPKSLWDSIL
jgi:hypothetical protein